VNCFRCKIRKKTRERERRKKAVLLDFAPAFELKSPRLLLIRDRRAALDLGKGGHGVPLELLELLGIDVDGEDHSLAAVAVGCTISLLAVEVAGLCICEGVVEWMQVGDVVGVEVVEVGVDISALELLAWVLEGRFGQGVVFAQEVEVHDAALLGVEEWWLKSQVRAATDDDGLDGRNLVGFCWGWGCRGRGRRAAVGGQGDGGHAPQDGNAGQELHGGCDVGLVIRRRDPKKSR